MAEKKLVENNYLPCTAYLGHSKDDKNTARFEDKGQFYFAILDESEQIILRSEGYKTEKGRENGIESALKNMPLENRYHTWQLPDGRWVLSLKAGNHQEIGRTCPQASESEAQVFLPSQRSEKKETESKTTTADSAVETSNTGEAEDSYLECNLYEANLKNISKYPDFIAFKHSNNLFYFAWISGNKIILRSEGFRTEAARDNGMESVIRNRPDKSKYGYHTAHEVHYITLRGANNSEIARSCPKKTEDDAWGILRTTAIASLFGLTTSNSKISAEDMKSATKVALLTPETNPSKSDTAKGTVSLTPKSSSGCSRWLWPLILLAILAGILWCFWNRDYVEQFLKKQKPAPVEVAAPAKDTVVIIPLDSLSLATKATWDSTLGKLVDIKLLNGESIQIPENGCEKKLVEFLNNGCKGDLKTTWFNLDRILFKTESSELSEISHDQLNVIARIFNAYPNASFKFGGYTDNKGNVESNTKLSGDRAAAVRNHIANIGVDTARITAEGYGPLHPICPANTTENCRAKNRRVALRIEICN